MKKLLPLVFFASFSALASDLSMTVTCATTLLTDGDRAVLTERAVTISSEGKNSNIFNTELGFDQDNSLIVALQETGKTVEYGTNAPKGTVYTLIVARVEDPTRNALQMAPKANIKGATSDSAQILVKPDGSIVSSYMNNGKLVIQSEGLPSKLGFSYKVSRKKYGKQNVEVSCSIQ